MAIVADSFYMEGNGKLFVTSNATKADLPDVQDAYEETKAAFAAEGIELRLVSAATHEGLDDLMHELSEMLML